MLGQKKWKSVQLVAAPQDVSVCYLSGTMPPLGLLSVGTCLKRHFREMNVEILDGELLSLSDIKDRIRADIVGLSVIQLNYRSSLEIARLAKERGKTVVFGGPYSTALPREILKNQNSVDYVVAGDGGLALVDLISGRNPDEIDNLVSREAEKASAITNGLHMRTMPKAYTIETIDRFDYSMITLEPYWRNFGRRFPGMGVHPLPVLSHKGCRWRENAGCIFCSIFDRRHVRMEPRKVWNEVQRLADTWGTSFLWDVGDDFACELGWMEQFARTRPQDLGDLEFYVYARTDSLLQRGMMDLLKAVNVTMVYVGFESGNERSLHALRKGITVEQNREVLRLISESNLRLCVSFIISAPGENEQSLNDTIDFCNVVKDELGDHLELLNASLLVPYPGSEAFTMLKQKCPKYEGRDDIDQDEAIEDWLVHFCKFSWPRKDQCNRLREIAKKLNSLGRRPNLIHA